MDISWAVAILIFCCLCFCSCGDFQLSSPASGAVLPVVCYMLCHYHHIFERFFVSPSSLKSGKVQHSWSPESSPKLSSCVCVCLAVDDLLNWWLTDDRTGRGKTDWLTPDPHHLLNRLQHQHLLYIDRCRHPSIQRPWLHGVYINEMTPNWTCLQGVFTPNWTSFWLDYDRHWLDDNKTDVSHRDHHQIRSHYPLYC